MRPVTADPIVRANGALTVVFTVSAVVATVLFAAPWKTIAATIAIGCFSIGVVVFLWSYWTAVQRSRQDEISVAALYFLVDGCAPKPIARAMNAMLTVQVVASVATASIRSSTDGEPGSTLAFGILVPMMGLGFNGLWGAMHGSFRPRFGRDDDGVPDGDGATGQDVDHD